MQTRTLLIALAPLALFAAGCELQKSENPLSPSIAGPIPGVEISAPKLLEPGSGWQIAGDKQPVTLLIENASSNSPRPLNYAFEVATDAGFTNKVFTRESIEPGDGGRTALRLPDPLSSGRSYYWRAKAQDGANTGPFSSPVSFNVFTPLEFDKPTPISPANNEKTADVLPEFRFGNAPRVGTPASTVTYTLEVALSDTFATPIVGWQFNEQAGETKFRSVSGLPPSAQLFWRVRASEGLAVGPWSNVAVFQTPTPVVIPTPTPTPGPGGSCSSATTHLGVVECRRKQYNHMNAAETNQFLRAVAKDLNSSALGGGPYGIYPKANGNQCLGYSCDIICTTGGVWDILSDWDGDQTPLWLFKGTNTGSCEIVK